MSTPTEEIEVDLAAADAKAAAEAAKTGKKPPEGVETPPIEVETTPATHAKETKPTVTPQEGIEKLQKQLEDERAARQAAEARANQAAEAEVKAKTEVQTSQLDLVKSAIERLNQASDTLESQYADAMAAQDFKAAAKAQREMAGNAAKLAQLEAGKAALEKAPKPTPRTADNPAEAFAAQIAPQWPRSADWIRKHPDFVTDGAKNRRMIRAHEDAIDEGHTVDSDGYFKFIEERLKITPSTAAPAKTNGHAAEDDDDPMAAAAQPVNGSGRSVAPAAAPVSRGGGGTGSQQSNRVKLTPDQIEAAHASFPDSKTPLEDYARQLQALKKEGRLQ